MPPTPRERLLRALTFQEVEMIPLLRPFDQRLGQFGGMFLEDESILLEKRQLLQEEIELNPRAVTTFMYPPDIYKNGWDQWGVLWENIHDVHHPIQTWDDYPGYEFPNVDPSLFPADDIANCKRDGRTAVFGGAWPIITFERYRTLRGFENALTDPILYPDRFEELLERIASYNLEQIARWVELGCDIIGFADDWGTDKQMLVSPELWRKFYKPIYKRMCDMIHESGAKTWMHSDGAITAILPDLVEVGLDILEPVQAECMEVQEVSERFRGRLVSCGGLDSRLVAKGDYHTVRKHVRETIEIFNGFQGGMMGSITNLLIPSIDVALALYHAYRRDS